MNMDNFTNRAEAYAKGRPGYTNETIEKITEFASKDRRYDYKLKKS